VIGQSEKDKGEESGEVNRVPTEELIEMKMKNKGKVVTTKK